MTISLALMLSLVAADVPVVSNPGFEQVAERARLPEGWQTVPEGWHCCHLPNQTHLVCYETKVGEGLESRALLIRVAEEHPAKNVAYNVMQDVPNFVVGQSYRVSARVKTQGLHNMPFICVQCLNDTRDKFVGFAGTPNRALDGDIEQWQRIETTVLVPEGTATFRIRVGVSSEGNAGGAVLIDDVEVVEVD